MKNSLIIEGTFEILEEIGSGSGGTVFLAYHHRLKKNVVLKKMKISAQKLLDSRAETDILKNLHHQYLPQVYDFIEIADENGDKDIYTVMDFIPGKSFEDLLREGKIFAPTQVAKYLRQLCEAVEYLHSQTPPILHGDIKPANVMLTPDDDICLIDFNISGSADDLEIIAFTRGYASPEQCQAAQENRKRRKQNAGAAAGSIGRMLGTVQNKATLFDDATDIGDVTNIDEGETEIDEDETDIDSDAKFGSDMALNDTAYLVDNRSGGKFIRAEKIDQRSDIFSIGATAYCLLLGRKPEPDYEKQVPISRQNVKVSEGLAYIIDKAMGLKPKDRFQTVTEMLRAMDSLGKKDKRYRRLVLKEAIFCTIFIILASLSSVMAYTGYQTIRSDMATTHFEHAKKLYENRAYTEDLQYILTEALADESIYDSGMLGDLYYLAAECCFETDEYESALSFYERAINYNLSNDQYYCNYAISLSKLGRLGRAANVIEDAARAGLVADALSLMRGELAAASGNIEEAESGFRECISMTDDPYLRARAYILYSDFYAERNGYEVQSSLIEKNIEILKEAESRIDESFLPVILERLADAYDDMASASGDDLYLRQAVEVYKRLIDLGWGTFNNYMDLALLYDELQEFESSRSTYETLLQKFGENYRVYKNLAFVEIQVQASLDMDVRKYDQFKEYYDRAVSLYERSGRQQDLDAEMQLLEEAYRAVADGGWLDEERKVES